MDELENKPIAIDEVYLLNPSGAVIMRIGQLVDLVHEIQNAPYQPTQDHDS